MEIYTFHRKDSLIVSAIEVIDELGIQSLSAREIAKRQGVSESAIFRHYKTKTELIISVLNFFSQFDKDIFDSVLQSDMKPEESIRFYINSFAEYYENYPPVTSIVQCLDVLRVDTSLSEKVKEIFNTRNEQLRQLIKNAQESNALSKVIESEVIVRVISGLFREICLKWRFEDRTFSLKEEIMKNLEIVLAVFKNSP